MPGDDEMRAALGVDVLLPWPSRDLSPNARVHRRRRAEAVRSDRETAWALAFQAGARRLRAAKRVSVRLDFHPPSARRHDSDNLVASCKAFLDGIADAIGIDDSRFALEAPEIGEPHRPLGAVVVRLRALN